MIPIEQTILNPPDGNCFAASVASILELRLDDVPNYQGDDWFSRWQEWLKERNLYFINFAVDATGVWYPDGFSILAADSPRGDYLHAVVCFDGQIVYDPHPLREMGLKQWREWTVFAVLNPK